MFFFLLYQPRQTQTVCLIFPTQEAFMGLLLLSVFCAASHSCCLSLLKCFVRRLLKKTMNSGSGPVAEQFKFCVLHSGGPGVLWFGSIQSHLRSTEGHCARPWMWWRWETHSSPLATHCPHAQPWVQEQRLQTPAKASAGSRVGSQGPSPSPQGSGLW